MEKVYPKGEALAKIKREGPARRARALALHEEGKTYKEISQIIGNVEDPSIPISIERAQQLVKRADWERRRANR